MTTTALGGADSSTASVAAMPTVASHALADEVTVRSDAWSVTRKASARANQQTTATVTSNADNDDGTASQASGPYVNTTSDPNRRPATRARCSPNIQPWSPCGRGKIA